MAPRGSEFPNDHRGVRAFFERDLEAQRAQLVSSGVFDQPWVQTYERRLEYSPARYVSFIESLGGVASMPPARRAELRAAVRGVLPQTPVQILDLLHVVAAKAR
jgi:hypothetical protein